MTEFSVHSSLLGSVPVGSWRKLSDWVGDTPNYVNADVRVILSSLEKQCNDTGVNFWFAASQIFHETGPGGMFRSWWSARPRRNGCGFGVTGKSRATKKTLKPGPGWTWDDKKKIWLEGWSFGEWDTVSNPAQIGRLLAYALTDTEMNDAQLRYSRFSLNLRPLPADFRGAARTVEGLEHRWADPGDNYADKLAETANAFFNL